MKRNNETLNHALHNEQVCNYLDLKPEFSDWVITTAFYTALQFVSYKIFPFEVQAIGGKKTKIESLNQFYSYQSSRKINKHQLLLDLVYKHCKTIGEDYEWLLNMSMNARYINYSHDREVALKSLSLVKKVKKTCIS
jgi:hypothetical protein